MGYVQARRTGVSPHLILSAGLTATATARAGSSATASPPALTSTGSPSAGPTSTATRQPSATPTVMPLTSRTLTAEARASRTPTVVTRPSATPSASPTASATARPSATPTEPVLPVAPAVGHIPGWLHTAGTQIVDANGNMVRLAAVNWYGDEGTDFVPGGLAYRPYTSILRTIKYLGFNTIRLPFSNELVERNPIVTQHVEANPWFRGMHALDILDRIIDGARQVGLMVILDNHRSEAGWTAQQNGLWYSLPAYTPQSWIADWVTLARRYRDNPAVVGFDLRNEPHSHGPGEEIVGLGYLHEGATWGPFEGVDNPASDWRLAAQQAGNAILAVDPHVLIVVEGVQIYPYRNPIKGPTCDTGVPATGLYCADVYWWGGNLAGAKNYPVVLSLPHHLVYSAHEYGPEMHGQRWITPTMGEFDWQQEMYRHWGFLLDQTGPNAAPVWIGEFGTTTTSDLGVHDLRGNSQGRWFSSLVHYLQRYPATGWSYWAINGTGSGGPGRRYGQRDSFGVLTRDWDHLSRQILLQALRTIQAP